MVLEFLTNIIASIFAERKHLNFGEILHANSRSLDQNVSSYIANASDIFTMLVTFYTGISFFKNPIYR